jgi:hypothetical protein
MYAAVLETIRVVPPGRAGIAFFYAKPPDWTVAPLPRDFLRKAGAGHFEPLVLATSPDGAALFTIGVLALPHGGATLQWLTGLCREGNVEIDATRQFAGGYLFNAHHTVDGRVTVIRKFYVESRGHLFAITAMAAQHVFATMELLLSAMTESFRLDAGPQTSFPSVLGITLPIPNGWTGFDDGEPRGYGPAMEPATEARAVPSDRAVQVSARRISRSPWWNCCTTPGSRWARSTCVVTTSKPPSSPTWKEFSVQSSTPEAARRAVQYWRSQKASWTCCTVPS